LRVPLKGRRRSLIVYILLEHQSEMDRLMLFRTLQYLVAMLSSQLRQWTQEHDSLEGFRFQQVLPIVFYTGTSSWPDLGQLADLFVDVPELAPFIPTIRPLFINLRDTDPSHLANDGGGFGQVLRVYQEREAPPTPFDELVRDVVGELGRFAQTATLR
jgi:Putative transposase, YhgA-like